MRFICLFLVLTSAVFGAEWQSLFDGKTLAGWKVVAKRADQDRGFWRATGGAIQADSIGRKDHDYVWLVHDGEFGDFELEMEVRSFPESTGNSGVQVRSRWDADTEWLHGPQIDIHPPAPWRTGLVYDETRETQRWIYPSLPDWKIEPAQGPRNWKWNAEGWNTIHIACRGGRITTQVNGQTIADADLGAVLFDETHQKHNVGRNGQIALQLHARDELKIEFRAIRIRRLH